ncbi:hypothetical protein Q787_00180 [Ornithobacterium rhinotracheale H06-030791]|uniref:Uncharacterized protein n=1 Tax=Ornithobacterium rhinotracheale (strain ATCC 51463 / DSM 15997 / CCUG 23171 / CIP 104009 / LMG 9086) TaxID=867902 RepID=I3ZX34_ORNRL|nr:hypothetical protein Ornrh_0037 [Ornithobacterium rhinotracheale DSM 15997]AIQ00228.1 hypothetical protein Q785_00180 [Ornithobacterium rhinotracheale ORT-UMN 88]KGB67938.1 hypothetical protein Q787_00180 [Ornithobacterium rhinotracheale H06-030791]
MKAFEILNISIENLVRNVKKMFLFINEKSNFKFG